MTKGKILKTLLSKKDYICQTYKVNKIGLFGSYARDEQREDSDIDFYVEFTDKTVDNITGLWLYLEKLYNKKIDIIHKHDYNNKNLIKQIMEEVIYP